MSRKDYEAIADALYGEIDNLGDSHQHVRVCLAVAKALASTNPRFDQERFMNACGWKELTGVHFK